ncbi:unnamed protein product, partial [Discosporangium mesarthrocarpum]
WWPSEENKQPTKGESLPFRLPFPTWPEVSREEALRQELKPRSCPSSGEVFSPPANSLPEPSVLPVPYNLLEFWGEEIPEDYGGETIHHASEEPAASDALTTGDNSSEDLPLISYVPTVLSLPIPLLWLQVRGGDNKGNIEANSHQDNGKERNLGVEATTTPTPIPNPTPIAETPNPLQWDEGSTRGSPAALPAPIPRVSPKVVQALVSKPVSRAGRRIGGVGARAASSVNLFVKRRVLGPLQGPRDRNWGRVQAMGEQGAPSSALKWVIDALPPLPEALTGGGGTAAPTAPAATTTTTTKDQPPEPQGQKLGGSGALGVEVKPSAQDPGLVSLGLSVSSWFRWGEPMASLVRSLPLQQGKGQGKAQDSGPALSHGDAPESAGEGKEPEPLARRQGQQGPAAAAAAPLRLGGGGEDSEPAEGKGLRSKLGKLTGRLRLPSMGRGMAHLINLKIRRGGTTITPNQGVVGKWARVKLQESTLPAQVPLLSRGKQYRKRVGIAAAAAATAASTTTTSLGATLIRPIARRIPGKHLLSARKKRGQGQGQGREGAVQDMGPEQPGMTVEPEASQEPGGQSPFEGKKGAVGRVPSRGGGQDAVSGGV